MAKLLGRFSTKMSKISILASKHRRIVKIYSNRMQSVKEKAVVLTIWVSN